MIDHCTMSYQETTEEVCSDTPLFQSQQLLSQQEKTVRVYRFTPLFQSDQLI